MARLAGRQFLSLCLLLSLGLSLSAQPGFYERYGFTRADTLRGMLRPERSCYDVSWYGLNLKIDPEKKSLAGFVDMHFRATADFERLQVDLFRNMPIDSIVLNDGRHLEWRRSYDAVFIDLPPQPQNSHNGLRIYYHGVPESAPMPPWDGGFVWASDSEGFPWVGVACEGDGASLWWPNKDHLSDEPDSMDIRITVPQSLSCISNGNLRHVHPREAGWHEFHWHVSYPINNYNVTVNIGKYVHFSDFYVAADGDSLRCDYYVLPENLDKAREHFKQVHPTLACFERFFGKYPFWEDGYALVETPYLGMEHQSAIAYGNKYLRGYLGGMIPKDMDWDYIIVHETGHEYWGNSISCNDLAEMWIHESFTTYMEALFVECRYDYAAAVRYLNSQRSYIRNMEPILGPADVNWDDWKASDHYYKGAWVLHTLRHALDDDELWFEILYDFYQEHAISHVTTSQFVAYVNERSDTDWNTFFQQYLQFPNIPTFVYIMEEKGDDLEITYRWEADVEGFYMPLLVGKKGDYQFIKPTVLWQKIRLKDMTAKDFRVAEELFYVNTRAREK